MAPIAAIFRSRTSGKFVPKIQIQKELYKGLSDMYGREAPLYKLLLAVNRYVNKLESREHPEWEITPEMLDQISSERHGAVRIAGPQEFKMISSLFKVMDMYPHNAYLMTDAGEKSQPIVGTGFRSKENPAQRMFCSTLMLGYFEPEMQERIKDAIKDRNIFSDPLKKLIQKSERQGGLTREETDEFIKETKKLFSWSGKGHHYELYQDLKKQGLGVAADIVCFKNPHLNHLTPSSLNIDRLVHTMKEVLAHKSLDQYPQRIKDLLEHVPEDEMKSYINNKGPKETIEGPASPDPGKALVFLRQWSYNALPENAAFINVKDELIETTHTARFGEIEQRGVAMTLKGRKIYDRCLDHAAETIDPKLAKTNYAEYEKRYAECFKPLDKTHEELRKEGLAYYSYQATREGKDAFKKGIIKKEVAGHFKVRSIDNHDLLNFLVEKAYISAQPVRYDDFLPVSAAGIFGANLGEDAKKLDTTGRSKDTKEGFEKMTGVRLIDSYHEYAGYTAQTTVQIINELGLRSRVSKGEIKRLGDDVKKYHSVVAQNSRAG